MYEVPVHSGRIYSLLLFRTLDQTLYHLCSLSAASAGSDTAAAVKGAADAAATSTDQKAKPSQQQQQPHSFKQGVTQPRPYQITEFKWSPFHLRLLNDVLACMENDVVVWKTCV